MVARCILDFVHYFFVCHVQYSSNC
jgi:hypothetical protein